MRSLLAGGALLVMAIGAQADCAPDRVDLRGPWGTARFSVEIADTAESRAQGLMNRAAMPRSAGMLFVYNTPQRVAFWMENTLIPLDILFMTQDGVIQKIHENAIPLDRTNIPGGSDIQYVLEINGGLSSLFGITPGTALRHPALDQSLAAWPCE